MLVVCDTETNAIINPDKLWVIVCKEVETGAVHVFRNPQQDPRPFQDFARHVTGWIGHNFIGYDRDVLQRLVHVSIPEPHVIDTLVVSRLVNYSLPGGHSLEALGERVGVPKIKFNQFDAFSEEMVTYCIGDCETTLKVYNLYKNHIHSARWKDALRLEHDIAFIARQMQSDGFAFDIEAAKALHGSILGELSILDKLLTVTFPPKSILLREITPKVTKAGTLHLQDFRWLEGNDLTPYEAGHPFSLIEFRPFNPGSPKQIVERLNEAGWKPYEKTDGHIDCERELKRVRDRTLRAPLLAKLQNYEVFGWKISEANLATLPKDAPEAAQKLVQRLLLASRASTLNEWITAYDGTSGRIHGNFNHIGAWTQRMSHSRPNMANIPAGESLYAHEFRSMWKVPKDKYLVGVDADGIQLRILAHYINDERFTKALVEGRKEDGTDAHSLNKLALGDICKSRDDAKTFIYAWLLGAGLDKIAAILGCSKSEAREANDNFLEAYPGLKHLKEDIIPRDADRGYFEGIDGRLVLCDNEHLMLAGYLQCGESTVMKRANVLWRRKLIEERVPFIQVNFVHDEWQTETPRDLTLASYVAQTQADSIRIVGEELNLKCPLAGSILNTHKKLAVGDNWSETH